MQIAPFKKDVSDEVYLFGELPLGLRKLFVGQDLPSFGFTLACLVLKRLPSQQAYELCEKASHIANTSEVAQAAAVEELGAYYNCALNLFQAFFPYFNPKDYSNKKKADYRETYGGYIHCLAYFHKVKAEKNFDIVHFIRLTHEYSLKIKTPSDLTALQNSCNNEMREKYGSEIDVAHSVQIPVADMLAFLEQNPTFRDNYSRSAKRAKNPMTALAKHFPKCAQMKKPEITNIPSDVAKKYIGLNVVAIFDEDIEPYFVVQYIYQYRTS